MKILIVSRYVIYPSWPGPAKHVQSMCAALTKRGHEVRVVSGENVDDIETIHHEDYEIIKVPIQRHQSKVESLTSVAERPNKLKLIAKKIINEFNPDVVHVGVFIQLGVFIEAAKEARIPISAIVHDFSWICMQKFLVNSSANRCDGPTTIKCINCVKGSLSIKRRIAQPFIEKFHPILKLKNNETKSPSKLIPIKIKVDEVNEYLEYLKELVDLFIIQSPDSRDILFKNGIKSEKSVVLHQWLVDEKLHQYPKREHSLSGKLQIGYIGRLDPDKGLNILGKALKDFKYSSDVELNILSVNATKQKLFKHMGRIDEAIDINIYDNLNSNSTLPQKIAELDLVIVPSPGRETGPRVLLEALAQKVPCIATEGLGNSHFISDNNCGELFNSGNHEELKLILESTIENRDILSLWSKNTPKLMNEEEWYSNIFSIHQDLIKNKTLSN